MRRRSFRKGFKRRAIRRARRRMGAKSPRIGIRM